MSRNGDQDGEGRAAAAAVVGAAAAKAEPVVEPQAKHQFGEERHDAGDDDGDHHHAHVAVADMGQLVAEHGFDLGIVEPVDAARSSP